MSLDQPPLTVTLREPSTASHLTCGSNSQEKISLSLSEATTRKLVSKILGWSKWPRKAFLQAFTETVWHWHTNRVATDPTTEPAALSLLEDAVKACITPWPLRMSSELTGFGFHYPGGKTGRKSCNALSKDSSQKTLPPQRGTLGKFAVGECCR